MPPSLLPAGVPVVPGVLPPGMLPAGVEIPELKLGKEHDVAVVIAKHGREDAAEDAAPAAADVPATKASKKDDK